MTIFCDKCGGPVTTAGTCARACSTYTRPVDRSAQDLRDYIRAGSTYQLQAWEKPYLVNYVVEDGDGH